MSPSEGDLHNLYEYCASKKITIHPSIRPKHVPGCGLGVYSTERIESGQQLVQVPVSEIFTTENIPEHFLTRSNREGIAVHAQLAAFFAFGEEADLEQYEAWMATWPSFDDFIETMPLFWGDLLASLLETSATDGDETAKHHSAPAAKKQKVGNRSQVLNSDDSTSQSHVNASKGVEWTMNLQSLSTIRCQVVQMAEKLISHVHSIHGVLPELRILSNPKMLTRFFHAWCLVNTRCFYYVPTLPVDGKYKSLKQKAPEDPNEAMGLCPFMDLFNHTAPLPAAELSVADEATLQRPCKVSSGVTGFMTTTKSPISANKEILFSYGSHTNDTLWSEYGFLLPGSSNSSDSVLLDDIILKHLTKEESQTLEDHDYLASYTLFNDGSVCYRTEMVAWLTILGSPKWAKCVDECLDPADLVDTDELTAENHQQRERNGTRSQPIASLASQHSHIIEGWLTALREQAQEDMTRLQSMRDTDILNAYRVSSIIYAIDDGSTERKLSFARRKQEMCIKRCGQISIMAACGVEASISGSFEES